MGPENIEFKNRFAGWQSHSAFNTYWQYSFVNRSAFYANINSAYSEYMTRWVQNYLWWYDGWVPYFHNSSQGIFSTRIATALVNNTAKKVIGGKVYFKNKNRETPKRNENGSYIINPALAKVTEWADETGFRSEIKKATQFAAAAGTALLKLDKREGKLYAKALRFDSFYPTIGINGRIIELFCFIKDFTKLTKLGSESTQFQNFYVVEHRYFADYKEEDGRVTKRKPLVKYEIKLSTGTITNGQDYETRGKSISIQDLPRNVRSEVAKAFDGIIFDKPIPLPFVDNLGAELVNWTECVSAIPELPFGDSLLTNIMPFLQSYDYYFSAFNTDMYLGRGKVILGKQMQSAKAKGENQNTGFDSMLFTEVYRPDGTPMEPLSVQFDLRSTSWSEIRTMIIQNIAINTGMNLATIASFLQDSNAQRTATEISTEESETALFVEDKRDIIEKPINRLIKTVTKYNGFMDDVVVRWSETGLTNVYARTDMLATAVQNELISPETAAQMFRQDDDEYQQAEEWAKIEKNRERRSYDDIPFNDQDYYGTEIAKQAVSNEATSVRD